MFPKKLKWNYNKSFTTSILSIFIQITLLHGNIKYVIFKYISVIDIFTIYCLFLITTYMGTLLSLVTSQLTPMSYLCLIRLISWLLMPWLLMSPGHQQPWYWLYSICRSLSYLRTWGRILGTCVISVWRNDIKCKYIFMFTLKNLVPKGLTTLHFKCSNVDINLMGFLPHVSCNMMWSPPYIAGVTLITWPIKFRVECVPVDKLDTKQIT